MSRDSVAEWLYFGKPVFPLSHEGFDPHIRKNISTFTNFPRWISSDLVVFEFETEWIAIEPGSDISTLANGFIVVDDSLKTMTIYHLWGE